MTETAWIGDFGDQYTKRNLSGNRGLMWETILNALPQKPKSILEVGANIGLNLVAIRKLSNARLMGLEPNAFARKQIPFNSIGGTAQNIPLPDDSVDMAFTCGVLIHIPPDELEQACREIYHVSGKYIVCIEYFSDKPEEVEYRGKKGLLWKRDFGSFWLDRYPLDLIDYGFFWRRDTGLDNLTYWIFSK